MHLLVKFSFPEDFNFDDEINVLLMIKDLKTPSGPDDNIRFPNSYAENRQRWTEVHRARVLQFTNYTELQYPLDSAADQELRVYFYRNILGNGDRDEICHADVRLSDLMKHQGKDLILKAQHQTKDDINGTVSFCVSYMRALHHRFACQLNLHINRSEAWPFKSARIFFILFTEAENSSKDNRRWLPRWRSDVMTPESPLCDRHGVMHFPLVILPNSEVRLNDNTKIRIEFFHFKRTGDGIMIGYIQTTAAALRSLELDSLLALRVSDYPQSELVGTARLIEKRITAKTQFYTIKAEFGGKVNGDIFVFNVTCANRNRSKSKLFFTICREPDLSVAMYRSGKPGKTPLGYQFPEAGISMKRMRGTKGEETMVALRLFRKLRFNGNCAQLAEVQLSLGEWLSLSKGDELSVKGDEGIRASVRSVVRNSPQAEAGNIFRISLAFVTQDK